MLIVLLTETDKTKEFRLNYMEEQAILGLRLVSTTGEVQVDYLTHRGIKYETWTEHGSFMKLLGKCLGRRFDGTRKKFIEGLYYGSHTKV
jgi:hypothetical protein